MSVQTCTLLTLASFFALPSFSIRHNVNIVGSTIWPKLLKEHGASMNIHNITTFITLSSMSHTKKPPPAHLATNLPSTMANYAALKRQGPAAAHQQCTRPRACCIGRIQMAAVMGQASHVLGKSAPQTKPVLWKTHVKCWTYWKLTKMQNGWNGENGAPAV